VQELVFRALGEYGLQPSPTDTDADLIDLERFYADRGGWFAVVEGDGAGIVGCVGLLPLGSEEVELRKMYLDRSCRGRGVGRAMLAAALVEARRRGFTTVSLETAAVLQEAVRLYESAGFRRRSGPLHAGRCDLAMERAL
jgi:putative acetyltransferase